jgi:hypothetical protein
MGTPAHVQQGTIGFDSPEQAREAFEVIKEWVNQANEGNLPEDQDGDYNIHNVEHRYGTRFICFTADSGRYQNLEWQMENLLKVCKPLEGIEYFDAPIMILSDNCIYWTPEDDICEEENDLLISTTLRNC